MAERVSDLMPPKERVKGEYIYLGPRGTKDTPMQRFLARIAEYEQELKKDFIPFCTKCAITEFEERKRKVEEEWMRSQGRLKDRFLDESGRRYELKVEVGDLSKFAGDKHFELISISEAYEKKPASKERGLIGYNLDYRCKKYGYTVIQFVDLESWNKLKDKRKWEVKK